MIFACPGIMDSETQPQDKTDLQSVFCFSSTWQIPVPTTRPEIGAAHGGNGKFVEGQVDSDQEIPTDRKTPNGVVDASELYQER